MYWVYDKKSDNSVPICNYTFNSFNDFYDKAKVLTMTLSGFYNIKIKTQSADDIFEFIKSEQNYSNFNIYIEVSDTLLKYVMLNKPGVKTADSVSNYEIFKSLIEKYKILFDKGVHMKLYSNIEHDYASMSDALVTIATTYPNKTIKLQDIQKLFIIEDIVYPRQVCIAYIQMYRWRRQRLDKCLSRFDNNFVLYGMRKNARTFLDEKIKYLQSGSGSDLIKSMPVYNLINLNRALDYNRGNFMDITTILMLYERGEFINDYL